MEPFEYLRLLRRRWRVVVACLIVAIAAAWVTTPDEPSPGSISYEASATIVRDAQSGAPTQALGTVGLFVRSGEVPRRVAERVGFEGNPVLLARAVETEADEAIGTLIVTATENSRAGAADLANAFVEETLSYLAEESQASQAVALQAVQEEIAQLEAEIDRLDAEIDDAGGPESTDAALLVRQRESALGQYGGALDQQQQLLEAPPATSGYIVLEPALAELATSPGGGFSAPTSKPVRVALGAALGLLLGLGVILVVERLDPRITTRGAAERAFELPVVAEVPYVGDMRRRPYDIRSVTQPSSAVAEAYRNLRAALVLMPTIVLAGAGARRNGTVGGLLRRSAPGPASIEAASGSDTPSVVLITSAAPNEGKTTTVANLAASFAETGRTVLVLGFDFRRPELHRHLGVEPGEGLAEVFTGRTTLAEVCRPTSVDGVRLVTHGLRLDNLGDVAAEGRDIVKQARSLADIVLIDSAPILATADAVELAPAVDSVLLIARARSTTRESAQRCVDTLSRLAVRSTGVVLIGAADATAAYSSYYYHDVDAQNGDGARARRGGRRRRRHSAGASAS